MLRSKLFVLAAIALVLIATIAACNNDQESYCDNVGNCEQGGSSDWVQGCEDEAKLLKTEAKASGCTGAFDDYYSCTDDKFECHGATAAFPGCEAAQKTLDDCLTKAVAQTACGELAQKTSACGDAGAGSSATIDASTADAASPIPPACTAARDCAARCFLDGVANVCAPAIDELTTFNTCASMCPADN